MKKYWLAAVLTVAAAIFAISPSESATGRNVILVHGWNGSTSSWATTKAAYEANGDTVHVLAMPKNSFLMSKGDGVVNAKFIQTYIAQNHLTNVVLDGHSFGAMESLYVALVLKDPAVKSVVLRDTGFVSGLSCFAIPDLCSNSAMATAIKTAPVSSVPIMNLTSKTVALPQEDCRKTYNIDHNAFQTNAAVIAAAIGWPEVC